MMMKMFRNWLLRLFGKQPEPAPEPAPRQEEEKMEVERRVNTRGREKRIIALRQCCFPRGAVNGCHDWYARLRA